MAVYNTDINRTDASTLINEEYFPQIFKGVSESSTVMRLGRRLPNMPAQKTNMAVLDALPLAYWVSGDTGLKQTTEQKWQNKQLVAAELAVIVPISEAVLDDSSYDIWGEIYGPLTEAFGKAFDEAVMFGTNAPTEWTQDDIVAGATAAGSTVTRGTGVDLYEELLGESGVLAALEADGYMATGAVAATSFKASLRASRDSNGQSLRLSDELAMEMGSDQLIFPKNGAFDASSALFIAGDWNQLVYSIRQDMTFKVLDQGVIQDGAGSIVYNLAQQDMVALRAVMRIAWQLPNPVNRLQGTEASRYPFAALIPA